MAVYTPVSPPELAAFLSGYDLGAPRALEPIAEGIENSNFHLSTDRGRFILTLFERRAREADLPFFLDVTAWAADRGFPCPRPRPDRTGAHLSRLNGRPAAVVEFLPGRAETRPSPAACRAAGAACARLHAALADFPEGRPNDLGVASWRAIWAEHRAKAEGLRPGLAEAVDADLDALERHWPRDLPAGVIHADLFPDNVFFDVDDRARFAGAIDFYFACRDLLAYDLAVMVGAWASDAAGEVEPARAAALVAGYAAERALLPAERAALPLLARGAAMRFFLTRLADWEAPRPGALVTPKDPMEYARRLDAHRRASHDPPPAWSLAT